MLMWLNNKAAANPKENEVNIEPFSTALKSVGNIYVKPVTIEKPVFSDSESEEEEEDGGDGISQQEEEEGKNENENGADEDAANPVFPPDNHPSGSGGSGASGSKANMQTD